MSFSGFSPSHLTVKLQQLLNCRRTADIFFYIYIKLMFISLILYDGFYIFDYYLKLDVTQKCITFLSIHRCYRYWLNSLTLGIFENVSINNIFYIFLILERKSKTLISINIMTPNINWDLIKVNWYQTMNTKQGSCYMFQIFHLFISVDCLI